MILTSGPDQYVVKIAQLKLPDGTAVKDFTTSQAVIDYLKAHPDREFLLETMPSETELRIACYCNEEFNVATSSVAKSNLILNLPRSSAVEPDLT